MECPNGYEYRIPEGSCCGSCYPQFNCTRVRCTMSPNDVCPEGTVRVKRGCCTVCEKELICNSSVVCPTLDCPANTKRVVKSGRCCPECEPIRDCSNVLCPSVKCEVGSIPIRGDLDCCERCEPIDRCATVLCARPPCKREAWIQRRGECCPQCPTCTDSTDGTRLCNGNDDTVCRAGYSTGSNCNTTVPPTDRVEVTTLDWYCVGLHKTTKCTINELTVCQFTYKFV